MSFILRSSFDILMPLNNKKRLPPENDGHGEGSLLSDILVSFEKTNCYRDDSHARIAGKHGRKGEATGGRESHKPAKTPVYTTSEIS